ncbi:MAG: hypothetical protein AB7S46_11065 [Flavobacteriaceae bacterium]
MVNAMSRREIETVFVDMNLPLIERGVDEIQAAKDRLTHADDFLSDEGSLPPQLLLSNGTAGVVIDDNQYAELERSSFGS